MFGLKLVKEKEWEELKDDMEELETQLDILRSAFDVEAKHVSGTKGYPHLHSDYVTVSRLYLKKESLPKIKK